MIMKLPLYTNLSLALRLCSSRREVYSAPTLGAMSSDSDHEPEGEDEAENAADPNDPEDNATTASSESSHGEEDTGTVWDSKPNVYQGN